MIHSTWIGSRFPDRHIKRAKEVVQTSTCDLGGSPGTPAGFSSGCQTPSFCPHFFISLGFIGAHTGQHSWGACQSAGSKPVRLRPVSQAALSWPQFSLSLDSRNRRPVGGGNAPPMAGEFFLSLRPFWPPPSSEGGKGAEEDKKTAQLLRSSRSCAADLSGVDRSKRYNKKATRPASPAAYLTKEKI